MKHLKETHMIPRGRRARLLIAASALLAGCLPLGAQRAAAADAPLVFEKTMEIPGVPVGPYSDVLSLDVAGGRIFATPQASKSVAVLDLRDGHVLKMLPGFPRLHGITYIPSLKRLFVSDGNATDLKVFSGEDYSLVKSIPLAKGGDSLAYDPKTQLLYVGDGGADAGMKNALISVIDPAKMEKIADIPVPATDLEALEIDPEAQRLYVNLVSEGAVAVVDLHKRQLATVWKLPAGKHSPFALAVDAARHRLYVTCREDFDGFGIGGTLFVLDTDTGKTVTTLQIGGWADGVFLDKKRQRFYVTTGVGRIETYAVEANDVYRRLPDVEIPLIAKHGLFSAELDTLYVDAPHLADTQAQVAVFKPAP